MNAIWTCLFSLFHLKLQSIRFLTSQWHKLMNINPPLPKKQTDYCTLFAFCLCLRLTSLLELCISLTHCIYGQYIIDIVDSTSVSGRYISRTEQKGKKKQNDFLNAISWEFIKCSPPRIIKRHICFFLRWL